MIVDYIELEKVDIQNLATSADIIEKNIDPSELAEIKKKDAHPLFELYRIVHTGISKTNFVGLGVKVLKWFSETIKKIHEKIKIGTDVFYGHVQNTNSHEGRDVIGRIVGKILEVIGDKVDSYGIVYRLPQFRDIKTDIASYEGKQALPHMDNEGEVIPSPDDIGDVTGLALAKSENDSPAFKRASFQFAVQNLVEKEEKMITKEDVKKFIKENNLGISDLFTPDEIKKDSAIEEIEQASQSTYNQAKRVEKDLKTARADLALEKEEHEETKKELLASKSETLKLQSTTRIEEIIADRGLSPNREKWVKKRMEKFTPSGEKRKIEKEINGVIDDALDEFTQNVADGLMLDDKKEPPKKEAEKETKKEKENGKDQPEKKLPGERSYTAQDGFGKMPLPDQEAMDGLASILGKTKESESPE
jgi:hypothetical protein